MRRRKKVIITAGPTRAYLDDVRFISNLSSGRLGMELCRTLLSRKFDVALVCGPTCLDFSKLRLRYLRRVETHEQMRLEVFSLCRKWKPDFAIFSAAVLDFVPVSRRKGKTSSANKSWTVKLKPSTKIIDEVRLRFPAIKRVGFKLEPETQPLRKTQKLAGSLIKKKRS